MTETRSFHVTERPEVPWLSVVLGYGPMVPFALGTLLTWLTGGPWRATFATLTVIWAASILAFLAGVRRGLSFRTPGGPTPTQIVTMFCLFVLAGAALVAERFGIMSLAVALVLVGFAALAILDPIAARSGEAPLFFARLRPPQLTIAVASLVALLVEVAVR